MTENLFAAVSGLVALSVLVTLIAADNKSWLWRKAMFAGVSGYTITALLYWLNQGSLTYLYPHEGLAVSSAIMMVPVALNYMLKLRGAVTIPDAVLAKLKAQPTADVLIADYTKQATDANRQKFRVGLSVAAGGLFIIGAWFYLNHNYGLAENFNGRQESIFKIVLRIASNQDKLSAKLDTVAGKVERNGSRITTLEARNRYVDKRDSLNDVRSLKNQAIMLDNQKKALRVLRPKAVPQPVQPIKPRRQWWQIGYYSDGDSLQFATARQ